MAAADRPRSPYPAEGVGSSPTRRGASLYGAPISTRSTRRTRQHRPRRRIGGLMLRANPSHRNRRKPSSSCQPVAPDMDVPAPVTSATLPPAERCLRRPRQVRRRRLRAAAPPIATWCSKRPGGGSSAQQVPKTQAAFARGALREWLEDHGRYRPVKTGEVMKAKRRSKITFGRCGKRIKHIGEKPLEGFFAGFPRFFAGFPRFFAGFPGFFAGFRRFIGCCFPLSAPAFSAQRSALISNFRQRQP